MKMSQKISKELHLFDNNLKHTIDQEADNTELLKTKLRVMEQSHGVKDKIQDEIQTIKREKEELHRKVATSVATISQEREKWSDMHDRLVNEKEKYVDLNKDQTNIILQLKNGMYKLQNQLNDKDGKILSLESTMNNYED